MRNNFIFEVYSGWVYDCDSFLGFWGITSFIFWIILAGSIIVIGSWAIENNLVYF